MSYRIEYQWASWKLTAGPDTGGVDRFVVAIEGGDNNLRDAVTGKRCQELGGLHARQRGAGAQAGRLLRRRLRGWLPQAGLAGLLTGGVHPAHSPPHRRRCASGARRCWYPSVRVAEAHPLAIHATQLDLAIEREQRYGEWFARVALSNERRNLIFDFADRFPDLRGWQLAAVSGLPAS